MTEREWLTSTDPAAMLNWVSGPGRRGQMPASTKHSEAMKLISNRKLRLFACAIARHGGCSRWIPSNIAMLHGAERMADGIPHGLAKSEIDQALVGSWLVGPDADRVANVILRHYEGNAAGTETAQVQADILRGIVGNPFRRWLCCLCARGPTRLVADGSRVVYACARCATRDFQPLSDTVTSLATAAYDERRQGGTLDPDRLLVLSDALVDAGCESAEVLDHLRKPTARDRRACSCGGQFAPLKKDTLPLLSVCRQCGREGPFWEDVLAYPAAIYYRGDWVVDLLLGKD